MEADYYNGKSVQPREIVSNNKEIKLYAGDVGYLISGIKDTSLFFWVLILNILLDKCMENPSLNTKESLLDITKGLLLLNEKELNELNQTAVLHAKHDNEEKVSKIRSKYKVR